MVKSNACEPVKKILLPKGTKVIDSTWGARNRAPESCISMHVDSNKLKECIMTEQVPTHLSQMLVPSKSHL
jgi:hypothetical protein